MAWGGLCPDGHSPSYICAERSRCYAHIFFEGGAENALTGESCLEANALYGKPCVFQQIFGSVYAHGNNILMRGEAGFVFKDTDKVIRANHGPSS